MRRRISKSQYLRGLQCLKSLWLHNFQPQLRAPLGPGLRHILDQGHKVGELARRLYPDGFLIQAEDIAQALEQTRAALRGNAQALFEPAFLYQEVLVRPDILVKAEDCWDLIEVKASTEIKEEHVPDVAVQRYVLEGAGLPVRKACLLRLDPGYVRRGEIDLKRMFQLEDLGDQSAMALIETPSHLRDMRAALALPTVPEIEIGAQCTRPHDCDFMGHCWRHVPKYSVYNLHRARFEQIAELRQRGVMRIEDIPEGTKLSEAQRIQVRCAKTRKPHLDRQSVRKCLAELKWPLYFLDFETINPAIPPFDGLRPHQPVPFQASLHVEDAPKGTLRHLEYLAEPGPDPRPGLVDFLVKEIGSEGSIVVYNAGFEGGRLAELAACYPAHEKALLDMKSRLWDLIVPFRKHYFYHPDFEGRASMKAVLPALAPAMSYERLEIKNGEMAFLAYEALMDGSIAGEEARRTLTALKVYCGQDTLGMVEVLKALQQQAQ